ncbi:hypothetical protein [Chitiniphilus eburneus]|uniref:DUF4129 domain-containing protein n=1 Tax=Chitiniphilus eburneus TaxID=2571148 RepID=A0A4U0QCF8_9NEIS|nr:hypothetical protein [Chitiniphilus eburneus]TJZ79095.1 hypothetical protein FAZ21_02070 [Chitiniphilus eburneus]
MAVDLGHALLRRHWRITYLAWWGPWALAAALLWLCLPQGWLWAASLALWWLRPIFERLPLFILSRAVFGEQVSVRQAWRAWPRQLGGWFRSLTWWRPFMVGRGLYAPIWQLEGARGAFASQRRKVLGARGAYGVAAWFGVACAHFEMVLQFAAYGALGLILAQPESANPFSFLAGHYQDSALLESTGLLCYVLTAGVIGPVYTAGCFGLYLCRRAELEGWDIELTLRQLAARRRAPAARGVGALAALLLGVALWWGTPTPAYALECAPPDEVTELRSERGPARDAEQAELRQQLDDVLSSEPLRGWTCIESWVPKEKAKDEDDNWLVEWLRKYLRSGKGGGGVSADALKVTLIVLLVLVLAWLLWRYRGPLASALNLQPRRAAMPPTEVCGMDIRPETLPEDVPDTVMRQWREGHRREALALLYRATVSRLAHDHGIELFVGATEGDVIAACQRGRRAGRLPEPAERGCVRVTEIWRNAAYARRWPTEDELSPLLSQWRQAFDGARP